MSVLMYVHKEKGEGEKERDEGTGNGDGEREGVYEAKSEGESDATKEDKIRFFFSDAQNNEGRALSCIDSRIHLFICAFT